MKMKIKSIIKYIPGIGDKQIHSKIMDTLVKEQRQVLRYVQILTFKSRNKWKKS